MYFVYATLQFVLHEIFVIDKAEVRVQFYTHGGRR